MDTYTPRHSVPKNKSFAHPNSQNSGSVPNMQPLGSQPLVNMANQFVPMQNNQMGMPTLGPVLFPGQFSGQSFTGFVPQCNMPNLNNAAVYPMNSPFGMPNYNQMNLAQPAGQFQNLPSFPQLMNQNMGLTNGQFLMQNMNQFFAMQMASLSQLGSFNVPMPHKMPGPSNQVNQSRGPQNSAVFENPQYGISCVADGERNQVNLVQPSVDVSAQKECPSVSENLAKSSPLPYCPPSAEERQALGSSKPYQGNYAGKMNKSNSWKQSPTNNFRDRPRNERFQNPKIPFTQNSNKKFDGNGRIRGATVGRHKKNNNASLSNQESPQPTRSISSSYTEQEVQQWREQRRKNHPSRAYKNELQKEKVINTETSEREANLRRQQLKEILAKQAALGLEVAVVPAHYLLDSTIQSHEGETENRIEQAKKDGSQNRQFKRGRINKRDQFSKRKRLANSDLSNGSSGGRKEPTLLQKLLSVDIRRDKHYLLQVFKFMVLNNFFKDCPDKPIEYPVTLVEGTACKRAVTMVELEPSFVEKASTTERNFIAQIVDKQSHLGNDDQHHSLETTVNLEEEEEEGEITS